MPGRIPLADLLAALSIAGLLLPEAVAYSGLASLPPQAGVLALFAGLLAYGLIGRSNYAIVTATSSSAAVLASALLALGAGSLPQKLTLAMLLVGGAGVAFVLAAALGLGLVSMLIARPVLRGYTFGLALVIAVKQWPQLVGSAVHGTGFFTLLAQLARPAAHWQLPALACGLAALAGLFALERVPRLPGALVVIIASIAASGTLAAHGVALVGPMSFTFARPQFTLPAEVHWLSVVGFSLAVSFILYAESFSAIRTFALRHDAPTQTNRDLVALGCANLLAALLQGTPVGAGYSGTAANEAAGARSRAAGLMAAAVVLALVALFLPWIERIPQPALAAIVIHAVSKSLRPGIFSNYLRWQRDRLVAGAAVLAVLVFGVLNGLLAAIAFSLVMLLRSLAQPRLTELGRVGEHDYVSLTRFPDAATRAHMLVLRPEEPLFFANAEGVMTQVRERLLARPGARLLVLSLEESPDLDSSVLEVLVEFSTWLNARGGELRLARLKERAREALQRVQLPRLGEGGLDYSSVDDAVQGRCVTPPAVHRSAN
jgi:MFS superfamily sulfate permease-like transporter